jgi:ketosteroid isomerase-like protein
MFVMIEPVDELKIRALLIRYSTAIDTKDWRLFRACFTEDCLARYGGLSWHGGDALTADFAEAHAPLDESMHRVLNISVLAHKGDTAMTRSYCDAVLVRRGAPGGPILNVHGVYSDVLRRGEEGWRIAEREFRAVWYEGSLCVMGIEPEDVASSYGDAVHDVFSVGPRAGH